MEIKILQTLLDLGSYKLIASSFQFVGGKLRLREARYSVNVTQLIRGRLGFKTWAVLGVAVHVFNPCIQEPLCECDSSLVYRMSSRLGSNTWGDPVLTKEKPKP